MPQTTSSTPPTNTQSTASASSNGATAAATATTADGDDSSQLASDARFRSALQHALRRAIGSYDLLVLHVTDKQGNTIAFGDTSLWPAGVVSKVLQKKLLVSELHFTSQQARQLLDSKSTHSPKQQQQQAELQHGNRNNVSTVSAATRASPSSSLSAAVSSVSTQRSTTPVEQPSVSTPIDITPPNKIRPTAPSAAVLDSDYLASQLLADDDVQDAIAAALSTSEPTAASVTATSAASRLRLAAAATAMSPTLSTVIQQLHTPQRSATNTYTPARLSPATVGGINRAHQSLPRSSLVIDRSPLSHTSTFSPSSSPLSPISLPDHSVRRHQTHKRPPRANSVIAAQHRTSPIVTTSTPLHRKLSLASPRVYTTLPPRSPASIGQFSLLSPLAIATARANSSNASQSFRALAWPAPPQPLTQDGQPLSPNLSSHTTTSQQRSLGSHVRSPSLGSGAASQYSPIASPRSSSHSYHAPLPYTANDHLFMQQLVAGAASEVGNRETSEDEYLIDLHYEQSVMGHCSDVDEWLSFGLGQHAFAAVYDGHGGTFSARYCRDHLHQNIALHISEPGTSISDAIELGVAETEQQLFELARQHDPPLESGTVLSLVLISGKQYYVAHAGDTRTVLCRGGQATSLTKDHRSLSGTSLYEKIAVSRALGDLDRETGMKISGLRSDVEQSKHYVIEDDEFLVIACDGVFDVMSDQAVITFARKSLQQHQDVQQAAKELVNEALKRGSEDNVTAVIVGFSRPSCGCSCVRHHQTPAPLPTPTFPIQLAARRIAASPSHRAASPLQISTSAVTLLPAAPIDAVCHCTCFHHDFARIVPPVAATAGSATRHAAARNRQARAMSKEVSDSLSPHTSAANTPLVLQPVSQQPSTGRKKLALTGLSQLFAALKTANDTDTDSDKPAGVDGSSTLISPSRKLSDSNLIDVTPSLKSSQSVLSLLEDANRSSSQSVTLPAAIKQT